MKDKLEKFILENRSSFDDLDPNEDVFKRLESKIYEKPTIWKLVLSNYWKMGIAASILFLIGLTGFWIINPPESNLVAVVEMNDTNSIVADEEIVQQLQVKETLVQEEPSLLNTNNKRTSGSINNLVKNTRFNNNYIFTLKNSESASARFTAASKALQSNTLDTEIVDVLFRTMENDENTNVRLAAFESLSLFANERKIKDRFITSLSKQNDPTVKVAIIELLTKLRTTTIKGYLQNLSEKEDGDPMVIEKAHQGLIRLNSI
jgi:hypothetical protein